MIIKTFIPSSINILILILIYLLTQIYNSINIVEDVRTFFDVKRIKTTTIYI
jgi:hypothetical protein